MIELRTKTRTLKNFAQVSVTLSLDTVASTFSVDGYLDLNDSQISKLFKPFTYNDVDVWFKDEELRINEKLITGTILNPGLSVQKNIRLTNISGYSKTGILEDVTIPPDLYPLQTDNLGLDAITKKFTDRFGLQLKIFDNAKEDAAKIFTQVKARPTERIKQYISGIARNRNITVAHDNLGRLLLYKVENKNPPFVRIHEDDQTLKISIRPNGQGVNSHITVLKQASTNDSNAGEATIKSPFVPNGVDRPLVDVLSYGENIDAQKMAEGIACRQAKAFPITIEKEGWTIQGKLIRSGFYIEVTAPSIFLKTTKLIVQRITFRSDPKSGKKMTITAVLPCVYTGVLPKKSPFK